MDLGHFQNKRLNRCCRCKENSFVLLITVQASIMPRQLWMETILLRLVSRYKRRGSVTRAYFLLFCPKRRINVVRRSRIFSESEEIARLINPRFVRRLFSTGTRWSRNFRAITRSPAGWLLKRRLSEINAV